MCLLSCGLEEFYFLDYIYDFRNEYNDTNAVIYLPPRDAEGYTYFNNFIIFYRLYLSDKLVNTGRLLEGSGTNNDRIAINTTLNSDYNGLFSLTDITSTSASTSNLENTFSNRRFFLLTLEDADINNVLGDGALGQRLDIAFPPNPGSRPTLTINESSYVLWRAVENRNLNPPLNFRPQPSRDFLNHPDLYNIANITDALNADVVTNTAEGVQYTYISMYIAARGTSLDMPPRTIYSQPTFIGIFRLANRS